jgi:hypothetical protein
MRYLTRHLLVGAALVAGAAGACVKVLGPDGRDAPQIRYNLGTHGTVTTAIGGFTGELLTVSDSTLVIAGEKITSIRTSAVTGVTFRDISRSPRTLDAKLLNDLKLRSRYPYGIPAPALAQLLEARGQRAPDVVER